MEGIPSGPDEMFLLAAFRILKFVVARKLIKFSEEKPGAGYGRGGRAPSFAVQILTK